MSNITFEYKGVRMKANVFPNVCTGGIILDLLVVKGDGAFIQRVNVTDHAEDLFKRVKEAE